MPPRRSHKKSKAGCQRCKNRKIKCDEVHPTCGNCLKHGVSCDFEGGMSPFSPAASNRGGTSDSTSHFSPVSTPDSSTTIVPFYQSPSTVVHTNAGSNGGARLLELKLMHHFTTMTSQTLSETPEQRSAWQMDIPSIAYDTQYLMDAILAVSALHLRSMDPEDQTLVRASHGYMASALAQYSTLLNNGLSSFNAEALFSTSALIAFQASASRHFDEDKNAVYTLPLSWFHSFQGVKAIVIASWCWLRSSEKIYPIINGQPALALDPDPQRKLFFSPLLEGMEAQLESLPESLRLSTKQAYEHSVSFLNWSHMRPSRARILGFAAAVSRRFIDLVDQHDPRAMVIVSCFFALTKRVDDVWWLQGVAKREVNGIFSLLPSDWWDKMEWPLMIANHEGPVDDIMLGIPVNDIKVEEETSTVHDHIDILAQLLGEGIPLD